MEKERVSCGIVGSGFAASFHYDALCKVSAATVEVRGVYSPSRDKRQVFARGRGIRAYDTLEDLLEDVQVVHVCSVTSAHERIAIEALKRDRVVIVEKPLTGYFGDGSQAFHGERFPKEDALREGMASVRRILETERAGKGRILYAENWVYAPAVQKEREIIEKTGAQILWIHGEQAHSGSHAPTYGYWRHSGGGSMMGKGCHPLTAALYLKRVEGRARSGRPIRPHSVTARTHALTRMDGFLDQGHIRRGYHDIEDFSLMHVVFDDFTVADVFASDIIVGGVHNWLEVAANNHRTVCHLNPNTAMQTYNPSEAAFRDVYIVEKTGTKKGWSFPSPDENWFAGYQQEIDAFYRAVVSGEPVESDSSLGADTVAAIYSAYLSAERKGAEVEIQQA